MHSKYLRDNGMIVEILIWQLPSATPDYPDGLKYRLYYGDVQGNCKVLYDIHKGKRSHKHITGVETEYDFIDIDTLIADFKADMEESP